MNGADLVKQIKKWAFENQISEEELNEMSVEELFEMMSGDVY